MRNNQTYYEILGVDPTASPAEISQQYYALREVYPQGSRREELEEAYRVLGWSREDYDNKLIEQGDAEIVSSDTPVDELFDLEEAETEGVSASSLAELMEETSIDNVSFDIIDSDDYDQLYEGEINMEDVVAVTRHTAEQESDEGDSDARSPSGIWEEDKAQGGYYRRPIPQKSHNDSPIIEIQNQIPNGIRILAVGLFAIATIFAVVSPATNYVPPSTGPTRVPSTPMSPTDELIQRGINDYAAGNYHLAVLTFSLAIEDAPIAQLYFMRGMSWQAIFIDSSTSARFYDPTTLIFALDDYDHALELDSTYFDVYRERGLLYDYLCEGYHQFCSRAYDDLNTYVNFVDNVESAILSRLESLERDLNDD